MPERNTTIVVSEDEKNSLDAVAADCFGESETIPYGVTLTMLMDEYET